MVNCRQYLRWAKDKLHLFASVICIPLSDFDTVTLRKILAIVLGIQYYCLTGKETVQCRRPDTLFPKHRTKAQRKSKRIGEGTTIRIRPIKPGSIWLLRLLSLYYELPRLSLSWQRPNRTTGETVAAGKASPRARIPNPLTLPYQIAWT